MHMADTCTVYAPCIRKYYPMHHLHIVLQLCTLNYRQKLLISTHTSFFSRDYNYTLRYNCFLLISTNCLPSLNAINGFILGHRYLYDKVRAYYWYVCL